MRNVLDNTTKIQNNVAKINEDEYKGLTIDEIYILESKKRYEARENLINNTEKEVR